MTSAFNNRIVKVGILIAGDVVFFQDVDIRIQGQKFFSPTNDFCTIKISNMTQDQRHWILTNTSPIIVPKQERTPTFVTIDIGRENKWMFRLFEGVAYSSTVTPPPDIGITLRSVVSANFLDLIQTDSFSASAPLSAIAQRVADKIQINGKSLILKMDSKLDRQIANYTFGGNPSQQIKKLQDVGNVRASITDGELIICAQNGGYNNANGFILSQENGMVSVPQATESGCTAQMLIDPRIKCGDKIGIVSKMNPSVNGSDYNISQMAFDIANRDNPFFYNLTLSNLLAQQGAT